MSRDLSYSQVTDGALESSSNDLAVGKSKWQDVLVPRVVAPVRCMYIGDDSSSYCFVLVWYLSSSMLCLVSLIKIGLLSGSSVGWPHRKEELSSTTLDGVEASKSPSMWRRSFNPCTSALLC